MTFDANLVFFEGNPSTDTPQIVPLNAFTIPGKMNPILMFLSVTEAVTGSTSIDIHLSESDTATGVYTAVPNSSISIATMTQGHKYGFKYLPRQAAKPYLKCVITPDATATAGSIFIAIASDDYEPYQDGLYIDKGIVEK